MACAGAAPNSAAASTASEDSARFTTAASRFQPRIRFQSGWCSHRRLAYTKGTQARVGAPGARLRRGSRCGGRSIPPWCAAMTRPASASSARPVYLWKRSTRPLGWARLLLKLRSSGSTSASSSCWSSTCSPDQGSSTTGWPRRNSRLAKPRRAPSIASRCGLRHAEFEEGVGLAVVPDQPHAAVAAQGRAAEFEAAAARYPARGSSAAPRPDARPAGLRRAARTAGCRSRSAGSSRTAAARRNRIPAPAARSAPIVHRLSRRRCCAPGRPAGAASGRARRPPARPARLRCGRFH
jgi:hypothetical protein